MTILCCRAQKTAILAVLGMAFCAFLSNHAAAQSWAPTATQAFPVQYVPNMTLIGALPAKTSISFVVGLQERNASQVQPTLQALEL